MQLTDSLYWYPWQGRANNCNSYLLIGKQTILFDPGHIKNDFNEHCLDILVKQIEADGINLADINYILCTHGHPDHIESVGLLREKCSATVGYHSGDDFMIEALESHYRARSGNELTSLKADFSLAEGPLVLENGSDLREPLEVVHTPGHSPGCVCFYLPDQQALISGDTVFAGSIGRADLPGGSMETLGNSIEILSQLTAVELLLPGHMGHISGADNIRKNFEQIKRFFF